MAMTRAKKRLHVYAVRERYHKKQRFPVLYGSIWMKKAGLHRGEYMGYLHLYCGDGKGKTTAALGLALRMAGAGKPVIIARFLKMMIPAR